MRIAAGAAGESLPACEDPLPDQVFEVGVDRARTEGDRGRQPPLLPGENSGEPGATNPASTLERKLAGLHGADNGLATHPLHLANPLQAEPAAERRFE